MEVVSIVLGLTMAFSKAIIVEHCRIGRKLNEFISTTNAFISMVLICINRQMKTDSFVCGLLFAIAFVSVSEIITSVVEDARRREAREIRQRKERMQMQREYKKVS